MSDQRIKRYSTILLCFLFLAVAIRGKSMQDVSVSGEETIPKQNMQLVLKDQQNTLIPVNVMVDEPLSFEEKAHDVYQWMQSSTFESLGLYPLIGKDIQVNGIYLDQQNVILDFTSSLEHLDAKDELRFVEGLVWTFGHMEGVETVTIQKDGETLLHMPHGLPIGEAMDQRLGLNNFDTVSFYLHKTTPLTIYASKNILGEDYYVPITRRIDLDTLTLDEQVRFVLKEISVSTTLGKDRSLSSLQLEKGSQLQEGVLTIHLGKEVLLDEGSIDRKLLSLISLSLKELDGVDEVRVMIDDQDVTSQKEIIEQVSEVISNPVKI